MNINDLLEATRSNLEQPTSRPDKARYAPATARAKTPTIAERLDRHRGWTTGFDYMRLVLAVAVLGWHTVLVSYGLEFEAPLFGSAFRPLIYSILPMFFILGGFLVTASFHRSRSYSEFVTLRLLRFGPALIAVVAVTALAIGPALTDKTPAEYFADRDFLRYWYNLFLYTKLYLPGVFGDLPTPAIVNVSVWTIPWEFGCSISLVALAALGLMRNGKRFFAFVLAANIVVPFLALATGNQVPEFARPPGHLLTLCFFAGVSMFMLRDVVRLNGWWAATAGAIAFASMLRPDSTYIAPFFLAYATLYLGLLNPPKPAMMKGVDLTYGIFVWSFPIQQIVTHAFPSYRHWWFNLLVALPISTACAWLSWSLVEAPVLDRKKRITRWVEDRVGLFWTTPGGSLSAVRNGEQRGIDRRR